MINREDTIRWRIVTSIAKCPRIPLERAKRAKKVGAYVQQEQEREKNPEAVAQTIKELQEQVQQLQEENKQLKAEAEKGVLTKVLHKIRK